MLCTVASPGIFSKIGSLRRYCYRTQTFTGGSQIFRCRERGNRFDTCLRIDIVHDVARQRTPFRQVTIFDLHTLRISLVEEQRDFATVQEAQEIVGSIAVEVGVSGRIVRIIDDDRRILAEQIPQAATVVKQ